MKKIGAEQKTESTAIGDLQNTIKNINADLGEKVSIFRSRNFMNGSFKFHSYIGNNMDSLSLDIHAREDLIMNFFSLASVVPT